MPLIKLDRDPGPWVRLSPGALEKCGEAKKFKVWVSAALGSAQEFFS